MVIIIIKNSIKISFILFVRGKDHLSCTAAASNDDQRTQTGPKIDIIVLNKLHQFAINLCEVSGPNYKINKNRFLGDCNKIAKNMNSILNFIHSSTPTPNIEAYKKIKLYSFQVYCK